MRIIDDDEHHLWTDSITSCRKDICEYYRKPRQPPKPLEIAPFNSKFARQCLLRRDWRNLAKLLSQTQLVGHHSLSFVYYVCAKYATICLAHTDEEMFLSYIKSIDPNVDAATAISTYTIYPNERKQFKKFKA